MASVDWKKIHGNSSGIIEHMTRHDGKQGVNYSNKDINPALTPGNYSIGWNNSGRSINYFLSQRVKELDAIHPPKRVRKDRVTSIGFVIHPPSWLKPEQESAFYRMAREEVAATCGGFKNVTDGKVHVDEIHEYYDKLKGDYVMSRSHMHMVGIPWTDEYGINAKHFMTRERMRDLNRRIDTRCMERWNQHYLSGGSVAPGRDMAQLKAESLACDRQQAEEQLLGLTVQEQGLRATIEEEQALKLRLEGRIEALKAEYDELSARTSKTPEKRLKRALEFMSKYADKNGNSLKDVFEAKERRREQGQEL